MNDTITTPDEIHTESVTGEPSAFMPAVAERSDPSRELEAVRTDTVSVRTEEYILDLRFQQQVGRVQGFRAAASGLNLGVIQWFSAIKANGDYKGRTFEVNGEIHSPKTFEELCDAMGFSRQSIYEALQNYATFGEERLTEIRNLGLTVKDTRKIRKAIKDVDEDTKKEIFRELKGSTPDDLRVTIDVICAQHAKAQADKGKLEKKAEKLEETIEGLKADITTKDEVAKSRNQQLDETKEALARATSPLPADVEVCKLQKDANARKLIDEKCNAALMAVFELATQASATFQDMDISEDTAAYVHSRVSLMVKDMAARILSAGIDVDLTVEFSPDFGGGEDFQPAETDD